MRSPEISHRYFSDAVERIAVEWRRTLFVNDWSIDHTRPHLEGETKPRWVRHRQNGIRGVGKPIGLREPFVPFAAYEKIAADLAFELGLPVPPVVLWDRGESSDGCRQSCVSLLTFDNVVEGATAIQLARESRKILTPAIGGMLPFYEWITATDRHDRHVLYGMSGDVESLAFIDFGRSFDPVFDRDFFLPDVVLDESGILSRRTVATKIAQMAPETVIQIVSRIPESFLSSSRKSTICGRLLAGRASVEGGEEKL